MEWRAWTARDEQRIVAVVRKHGTDWPRIANAVGRKVGAVRQQVDRNPKLKKRVREAQAEWREKHREALPDLPDLPQHVKLSLAEQNRELKKQNEELQREKALLERIQAIVRTEVKALPPLKLPPAPKSVARAKVVEETLVSLWGDWHAGEIVDPVRVKNLNAYNSHVFMARAGQLVKTLLGVKRKLEQGAWRFPQLAIPLLGDMVTGSIHELEKSSDETICRMTVWVARYIADMIMYLIPHFNEIHVLGVCGNHGRLPDQKRKQYKEPERNWDFLIYQMVEQFLREQKTVHCFFPASYVLQCDIRGWRFQVNHLDDVKSWMSIPFYGLDRHARNQQAVEAARREQIHYFIGGHFHMASTMPMGGAEMVVNGDMKGPDEYVLGAIGTARAPSQTFFGVHKEHGKTHTWQVNLTRPDDDVPLFAMPSWEEESRVSAPLGSPLVYRIG